MLGDLRGVVIPRDQNIGEGFVVAHQHVEARLQLLDEIGLEQQRVGLGLDRDEHHVGRRGDHPGDAVHMAGEAGVARHALSHVLGLADIEHLAVGGDHPIDAGPLGAFFQWLLISATPRLTLSGASSSGMRSDAGTLLQREIFFVLRDVIPERGVVGPIGRNHEADLGAPRCNWKGEAEATPPPATPPPGTTPRRGFASPSPAPRRGCPGAADARRCCGHRRDCREGAARAGDEAGDFIDWEAPAYWGCARSTT